MPIRFLLAVLALLAVSGAPLIAQDARLQCPTASPSNPWAELEGGNGRFASGHLKPRADACRRACTDKSQKPYAVVLSCCGARPRTLRRRGGSAFAPTRARSRPQHPQPYLSRN